MILNHAFKVSYVLEGMSSRTCYGDAVKGVDLQDTSYSAITAWMNTLCLLVKAKWVSPERVPAKITSASPESLLLLFCEYCSLCQPVPSSNTMPRSKQDSCI